GLLAPGGAVRYVTLPTGARTVIAKVQAAGGRVVGFRSVKGSYGIPFVTNNGETGGLSRDGRKLVVATAGASSTTKFLVLSTKTLKPLQAIVLNGSFSYDALSPDAATMYLIEHTSTRDF